MAWCRSEGRERVEAGSALYARERKAVEERSALVGKRCEPRLKSQRVRGREREAGWERRRGASKRVSVAMPPEERRAVDMLVIWRACVVDMVEFFSFLKFFLKNLGGVPRKGEFVLFWKGRWKD